MFAFFAGSNIRARSLGSGEISDSYVVSLVSLKNFPLNSYDIIHCRSTLFFGFRDIATFSRFFFRACPNI